MSGHYYFIEKLKIVEKKLCKPNCSYGKISHTLNSNFLFFEIQFKFFFNERRWERKKNRVNRGQTSLQLEKAQYETCPSRVEINLGWVIQSLNWRVNLLAVNRKTIIPKIFNYNQLQYILSYLQISIQNKFSRIIPWLILGLVIVFVSVR